MSSISIIVPVFNVEKYIKECIISLLNQTFKDFELIFVDDNSSDNTVNIIKSFKDERIKILKNEGKGAGCARNLGLKNAAGKWIIFYDGDDFCKSDYLEKMVKKAENINLDILICATAEFIEKKHKISRHRISHTLTNLDEKFVNGVYNLHQIIKNGEISILEMIEPWGKIYKKDFLISNNIMFPKILCAEDTPFLYKALFLAQKISFIKDELVYIRRRPSSLSFSTNKNWINYFLAYELADEIIKKYEYFEDIIEFYLDRKFNTLKYFYKKVGILFKIPYLLKFKKQINFDNKTLGKNKYSVLKVLF